MSSLVCEWAVDMYSRVEEDRSAYLRSGRREQARYQRTFSNQNKLSLRTRDEDARDRGDPAFESGAQEDEFVMESSISASFLGSRQWAFRQVANCLALARVYRQPSLFITVIINPRWPEIQQRLRPGQHPLDIPHVLARVFQARLRNLIRFIKSSFVNVTYIVHVVEFRKRGFPHAHIMLKVRFMYA